MQEGTDQPRRCRARPVPPQLHAPAASLASHGVPGPGGVGAEVGSLRGQRSFGAWPQLSGEGVGWGDALVNKTPLPQAAPPGAGRVRGPQESTLAVQEDRGRGLGSPAVEVNEPPAVRNLPKTHRGRFWNPGHRGWTRTFPGASVGQKYECRREGTDLIPQTSPIVASEVVAGSRQRRWDKFRQRDNRRDPRPSLSSPPPPPSLSGKPWVFRTCQGHTQLLAPPPFKNPSRADEIAQWVRELAAKN